MGIETSCIYCNTMFDPRRGEGDHVIPSCLGEFRNDTRFRRMCPACNSIVGQSEQQLVQNGPEGFFRDIIRPNSKRLGKRGRGRPKGAMGTPPRQQFVVDGDSKQLVEPTGLDPREVRAIDQVEVVGKNGVIAYIRLFPGMRPDQVRQGLRQAGVDDMKTANLHCAEKRWDNYQALLAEVWPAATAELGSVTPAGKQLSVQGIVTLTVKEHYFRALAKIAFHYYLIHTRRGFAGSEACFAPIRDFILNGGGADRFVDRTAMSKFVMPFGELQTGGVISPTTWGHLLAAREDGGAAIVYLQLFLGPGCIPTPHCFSLGRFNGDIVVPNAMWAHTYQYDLPQRSGRFAGEVFPANLTRRLSLA